MCRLYSDLVTNAERKTNDSKHFVAAYVKVLLDVNFWIISIYRLSHLFVKLRLYPISKLFWLFNRIVFTVDIDPRADLAGGLVLVHGMGIVIGHEVITKGKLKIYQGVTLGGNIGKRKIIGGIDTGQPVIDANVIIGINACVLGPVKINPNSIVGTGAIVTKDIPSDVLVLGVNQIRSVSDGDKSD